MRKTIRAKGCKQSFCYLENWDSEREKNGSMNKAKSKSVSGLTGINCILKNIKVKISKFKKYYELRTKKTAKCFNSGFSLIESLLSLSFFLIILVASLEFFISTRNHFFDICGAVDYSLQAEFDPKGELLCFMRDMSWYNTMCCQNLIGSLAGLMSVLKHALDERK